MFLGESTQIGKAAGFKTRCLWVRFPPLARAGMQSASRQPAKLFLASSTLARPSKFCSCSPIGRRRFAQDEDSVSSNLTTSTKLNVPIMLQLRMAFSREQYLKYYGDYKAKCFDILGRVCRLCGSAEELEIDHIDWRQKSINILKCMAPKRWPEVVEELRKCQALCKTCHRKKSAVDQAERKTRPVVHGTHYRYKQGCRCEPCRVAYSDYKRDWRLKTGETSGVRGRYQKAGCGRLAMYRKGCRCTLCRRANADAVRSQRKRGALAKSKTHCA
jgi:5-methylcytosine-specific restriction endonuclease McrA